jgi:hypothetical protein
VAPKQAVVEDEKEMGLHNQYGYNPQQFLTVYFDQKHLHQLLFLPKNKNQNKQQLSNSQGNVLVHV